MALAGAVEENPQLCLCFWVWQDLHLQTRSTPHFFRETHKTEEYEGSIRGKHQCVFKLHVFLHRRETPFPLRAGRACSSTQLCRAETSTAELLLPNANGIHSLPPRPLPRRTSPSNRLAVGTECCCFGFKCTSKSFITVSIIHKDFLLNQELHLNSVNPCSDLEHTL